MALEAISPSALTEQKNPAESLETVKVSLKEFEDELRASLPTFGKIEKPEDIKATADLDGVKLVITITRPTREGEKPKAAELLFDKEGNIQVVSSSDGQEVPNLVKSVYIGIRREWQVKNNARISKVEIKEGNFYVTLDKSIKIREEIESTRFEQKKVLTKPTLVDIENFQSDASSFKSEFPSEAKSGNSIKTQTPEIKPEIEQRIKNPQIITVAENTGGFRSEFPSEEPAEKTRMESVDPELQEAEKAVAEAEEKLEEKKGASWFYRNFFGGEKEAKKLEDDLNIKKLRVQGFRSRPKTEIAVPYVNHGAIKQDIPKLKTENSFPNEHAQVLGPIDVGLPDHGGKIPEEKEESVEEIMAGIKRDEEELANINKLLAELQAKK